MIKVVTATEARIHFGEILREVEEKGEVILVKRSGTPAAVIAPAKRLDDLVEPKPAAPLWESDLDEIHELVRREQKGRPLPDVVDLFDEMRRERSEDLDRNLL
jgi:prevent-host-death family protein